MDDCFLLANNQRMNLSFQNNFLLICSNKRSFVIFQVVDSLRDGNEALKEVNKLLSIDDIERILEETKEGAEKQEASFKPSFSSVLPQLSAFFIELQYCSTYSS
jgi:hypothetical protein